MTGVIPVRRQWITSPPVGTPVDRSSSLSDGLVFAAITDGLVAYDCVGKSMATQSGVHQIGSELGLVARLDANSDEISFPNGSLPDLVDTDSDFSVLCMFNAEHEASGNQRLLHRTEDSGSPSAGWQLVWNPATSANLQWNINRNSVSYSANYSPSGAPGLDPGIWYTAVCTAEWTGSAYTMSIYVDGFENDSGSFAGLGLGDNDTFYVGKRRASSDSPWRGDFALLLVFRGVLPAGQRARLFDNPWQVFRPRTLFLANPGISSGGGPTEAALSAQVDLTAGFDAIATRQGAMAGAVDFSSSEVGEQTLQAAIDAQVDFAAALAADLVASGALSAAIDFTDSYSTVLTAASAISEAVDFGETWASIATQIAAVTENVDLSDNWAGALPGTVGEISGNIDLSAQFATDLTSRASFDGQLDAESAYSAILSATASITNPVDLADVQQAFLQTGVSQTEAVELAASFVAAAGEIARAVQILVAARNHHVTADRRKTDVVARRRTTRVDVKKLN